MSAVHEHVAAVAAPKTAPIELRLGPKPEYPRQLVLERQSDGKMVAYVYPAKRRSRMLAWASAEFDRCRVAPDSSHSSVWIGSAAFDVTAEEAARIARTFQLPVHA